MGTKANRIGPFQVEAFRCDGGRWSFRILTKGSPQAVVTKRRWRSRNQATRAGRVLARRLYAKHLELKLLERGAA